MLNQKYLANPHLTGENRLPARSLLIPAQKKGITHKNFTESDRFMLLNGIWKFSYQEEDTDERFYTPELDDTAWDDLPVPSMWQYQGYGTCFYPNVAYCFPYDPPYVHCPNPVGLYRRKFNAKKPEGRAIIRFEGVDNAYFVWLNGKYVGIRRNRRDHLRRKPPRSEGVHVQRRIISRKSGHADGERYLQKRAFDRNKKELSLGLYASYRNGWFHGKIHVRLERR